MAEREDFMKFYEIKAGIKFYDELNGRYIEVVKVDHFSDQVVTRVTEPTCDEDGNDTDEVTETVLFRRCDLCRMTLRD